MSVKMKFGSKDIPFVYKGDKLVYPNPIKDGLLLWYDFKGMRNTDTNKEVAKDLSGNGNDGTLTNFNFTEGSGYKDNTLVFDGVDDSLTIPELELDETAMSVMHDGKLYAYEDDKALFVGEDGEIIEGRNLFLAKRFYESQVNAIAIKAYGLNGSKIIIRDVDTNPTINYGLISDLEPNTNYIVSFNFPMVDRFEFRNSVGEVIGLTKNWSSSQKYFNFTTDGEVTQMFGKLYSDDSKIEYPYELEMKVEKGTIATEWSPAPEDFQTTSLSPSSLSNLQLYNRPLRKSELLHNAESKGLKELVDGVIVQDGLVLHYDFSHESNTSEYKDKAFDYSGNGNHGVLNNFNFTEESGYKDKGLKYDNIDDFVTPNLSERVTDFTILSTVYFSEEGSGMIWGGTPSAFYLRRNLGHALHGSIYISGGEGIAGKQKSTHESNVFVANEAKKINVGMVVDNESQTYSLIVNGEIVRSIDISDELETAPFLLTHVGTWPTLNYSNLDGSMHSFQMYNRVLTPEEIAHNYQIEKEKFNITEGDA